MILTTSFGASPTLDYRDKEESNNIINYVKPSYKLLYSDSLICLENTSLFKFSLQIIIYIIMYYIHIF